MDIQDFIESAAACYEILDRVKPPHSTLSNEHRYAYAFCYACHVAVSENQTELRSRRKRVTRSVASNTYDVRGYDDAVEVIRRA